MTVPIWQATGTKAHSDGASMTVNWPTHEAGDIGLLIVETEGDETPTLSLPSGFSFIEDINNGSVTRLSLWWCRASSSAMVSPVVAVPADHAIGCIMTVRGASKSHDPFRIYDTATDADSNPAVGPIITGAAVDDLYVVMYGVNLGSLIITAWVNPDVSLTERVAYDTTLGSNGAIAVATGPIVAGGTISATEATITGHAATASIALLMTPLTYPGNSVTFLSDYGTI